MPQCVLRSCKNNARKSNVTAGVSYFRFPSNLFTCAEWISIVARQRREYDLYKSAKNLVICSDHFDKSDISGNSNRRRLVKTSVPKLKYTQSVAIREKRHNEENFNVLLNLYKMNPLKRSKLFTEFSEHILLPKPDGGADLNYNYNESGEEKKIVPICISEEIYSTGKMEDKLEHKNHLEHHENHENYREWAVTTEGMLSGGYYEKIISNLEHDDFYAIPAKMSDKAKFANAEVVIF